MRRALLLAALASAASAQPADWSTLTPAVGMAVPWAGGFGEAWEARPGPLVRVEAPAYGGRARVEVRMAEYEGSGVPAFALLLPTLGWGPSVDVGPARLGVGARLGAGRFEIDDDAAGNLQNETEVAVGAWAGGALRRGRAEVWAEVDATRLALAEPVTLVTVAAGLAVRADVPRWLRGVLR